MDSKAIIRLLKQEGWIHKRTTGSHWHFMHPSKKGIVTVPHPKREFPKGTLKSIAKQSGIVIIGES